MRDGRETRGTVVRCTAASLGGVECEPGREAQRVSSFDLRVGAANDPAESEADRLADAVIARLREPPPAPTGRDAWPAETRIRRAGSASVAVPAQTVRRSSGAAVGLAGGSVDVDTAHLIEASRTGGIPLPHSVRRSMEPAFGTDFSGSGCTTTSPPTVPTSGSWRGRSQLATTSSSPVARTARARRAGNG